MQKTPQQFKRLEVKQIIDRVLKKEKKILKPLSIIVKESLDIDHTMADFSFQEVSTVNKDIELKKQKGKGFIDGLFAGLHNYYWKDYPSLKEIVLVDYNVNPILSKSKTSMGTDAQASVCISVNVGRHGVSEFQHQSRSMIYSSFVSTLEAFQFYINCEECFSRIQFLLNDARKRNRGDIESRYVYDLSKLTEVNSYEERWSRS